MFFLDYKPYNPPNLRENLPQSQCIKKILIEVATKCQKEIIAARPNLDLAITNYRGINAN